MKMNNLRKLNVKDNRKYSRAESSLDQDIEDIVSSNVSPNNSSYSTSSYRTRNLFQPNAAQDDYYQEEPVLPFNQEEIRPKIRDSNLLTPSSIREHRNKISKEYAYDDVLTYEDKLLFERFKPIIEQMIEDKVNEILSQEYSAKDTSIRSNRVPVKNISINNITENDKTDYERGASKGKSYANRVDSTFQSDYTNKYPSSSSPRYSTTSNYYENNDSSNDYEGNAYERKDPVVSSYSPRYKMETSTSDRSSRYDNDYKNNYDDNSYYNRNEIESINIREDSRYLGEVRDRNLSDNQYYNDPNQYSLLNSQDLPNRRKRRRA